MKKAMVILKRVTTGLAYSSAMMIEATGSIERWQRFASLDGFTLFNIVILYLRL